MTDTNGPRFRRIATEEAFSTPAVIDALHQWLGRGGPEEPDWDFEDYLFNSSGDFGEGLRARLLDLDGERLQIMDENGVDVHLLSLTAPGPQPFADSEAVYLATQANDLLADAIAQHPTRYAGLAAVAPQVPDAAAKEIDRAINKLGLNGVIINSHTRDEYLDDEKYWPILEAAESLDVPIYLHPRCASTLMAPAYFKYDLQVAIWGFQAETGLHAMRLLCGGIFDRFPKLKIVLGHMGEGLPYWLHRIDRFQNIPTSARNFRPKLELKLSEYIKRNFYITTSGMPWDPVLKFCIDAIGADRIMFAIDYPYEDTAEAVQWLDAAPISDADKHKIYHENAERVFRIAP